MMKFLRSQSQTVLIVILGILGLSFLFYGASGTLLTSSAVRANTDFGSIEGDNLTANELFEAISNTRHALILAGRGQDLQQSGAREQIAEEAWRQLLLLHEADRLHIEISNKELVDYIQGDPLFQKDHVYSPDLYQSRMAQIQGIFRIPSDPGPDPLATTKATVETIMRNNLRAKAADQALFSTVRNTSEDIAAAYDKIYAPADVSLVSFDPAGFRASVQVLPADIEAEYKAHPEKPAYRTKEKRKVDYVIFPLTPDQARLPDADKKAALEALGERALDFALAFQPDPGANPAATPPPDFFDVAKKRGLTPVTTDLFTVETPPAGMPPSPSFNNAAFALTRENPVSKVIELSDGVAVLHLEEIQPSELRPLAEIQADIQQQLAQTRSAEQQRAAAQAAAQSLQAAVAKGTDFKTAAAALNLKVETLPTFVPNQAPSNDQRLQTLAYYVTTLKVGQVSNPVPMLSDASTVILHLDARGKADPAGFAAFESQYRQSHDQELHTLVYIDWANAQSKRPGTRKPPGLDSYGSMD